MKRAIHLREWIQFSFLLIVLALGFSACKTSNVISSTVPVIELPSGKIAIFQDSFKYMSIMTDQVLNSSSYQPKTAHQSLFLWSRKALKQKPFEVINEVPLAPPNKASIIPAAASHLAANVLAQLQDPIQTSGASYILLLSGLVKVGSTGGWDLLSGIITSDNSYTRIKAYMINATNGKILWRNEVQLRIIPSVGKREFPQAIDLLFQPLKSVRNEKTLG